MMASREGLFTMGGELKMLAQELMGINRKINLGKNLESEEKPSITSLLTTEIFSRGRRDKPESEMSQVEAGKKSKQSF